MQQEVLVYLLELNHNLFLHEYLLLSSDVPVGQFQFAACTSLFASKLSTRGCEHDSYEEVNHAEMKEIKVKCGEAGTGGL